MKLLPCPFCGHAPDTFPKDPKREGNAWGEVACVNRRCHVRPSCKTFRDRTPIQAAARRWNRRKNPTNGT